MAGQPQDNPWAQQGQAYPQGAPGYGPGYDQQPGQPAPHPPQFEQQPYEPPQGPPPGGYEGQTAIYEQQPEYGYPPQPGQPHPGQQPHPGPGHQPHAQAQPQSQEQQDWEQWQASQQAAQQQAARQQSHGQNRSQNQRPSGGQQGFVSSLFDFGFTSFVTPKIIKALYAVVAAWTILWAIILLFIGHTQWGLTGLLVMLIIVDPLLILVSLGLVRVALEFFMITFRMQEDLKALREQGGTSRGDGDTVVGRVAGPDA